MGFVFLPFVSFPVCQETFGFYIQLFLFFSFLVLTHRLFEANGELKSMFTSFEKLKYSSDLRESRHLKNHALMVMCTLDEAITNLDDLDYVTDILHKIGRTHTRFQGYTSETFWVRYILFILVKQKEIPRNLDIISNRICTRTFRNELRSINNDKNVMLK